MAAHHRNKATGRTEEEVVSLFEEWIVEHDKLYNTPEEKNKRFQIFKKSLLFIDKENSANRGYWLGLNPFSDLTNKEFKTMWCGFKGIDPPGTSMAAHHRDKATGRTEEEVVSLYEEWLVKHGKLYNTLEEKDKRFQIFKDNLRLFDKINSANRGSTVGQLGPFTDLTNEEFKAMFFPIDPNRR
ncbi:hypothetical protein V8G54_035440 [Vigna mungo]|uniref:Cathepsin propeptide inhibitor domain-containing protein n=1 Tax=Vigna mungo TaxID=3915 RepID=A0AAQ3MF01_VIGMU